MIGRNITILDTVRSLQESQKYKSNHVCNTGKNLTKPKTGMYIYAFKS